jgi:hypothetical protein
MYKYIYTIYTRPRLVQTEYSRSCPTICCSCYNGSLGTWTVVCLTATKFKPLIFPLLGSPCPILRTFAFSLFCVTSAVCLRYIVIYVRKFESHLQIANRRISWKMSSGAENFCFAGAAISVDGYLPRTPRRGKHKSLYSYRVLCGGPM